MWVFRCAGSKRNCGVSTCYKEARDPRDRSIGMWHFVRFAVALRTLRSKLLGKTLRGGRFHNYSLGRAVEYWRLNPSSSSSSSSSGYNITKVLQIPSNKDVLLQSTSSAPAPNPPPQEPANSRESLEVMLPKTTAQNHNAHPPNKMNKGKESLGFVNPKH